MAMDKAEMDALAEFAEKLSTMALGLINLIGGKRDESGVTWDHSTQCVLVIGEAKGKGTRFTRSDYLSIMRSLNYKDGAADAAMNALVHAGYFDSIKNQGIYWWTGKLPDPKLMKGLRFKSKKMSPRGPRKKANAEVHHHS